MNIADMTAKTGTADTQNQLSAKLYRDAETATQSCNLAVGADFTTPGTVNYYNTPRPRPTAGHLQGQRAEAR